MNNYHVDFCLNQTTFPYKLCLLILHTLYNIYDYDNPRIHLVDFSAPHLRLESVRRDRAYTTSFRYHIICPAENFTTSLRQHVIYTFRLHYEKHIHTIFSA